VHARFHAPAAHRAGETITLPPDEAAHATRVLRLAAGDRIHVFDGRGHEFQATITRSAKHDVDVLVGEPIVPARERRTAVTLAQAMLKGEKMDDVVRDAVMMGVTTIVPLVTERTEVPASALQHGRRRERWERIAVVSTKQCGRAVVPSIEEPCALREFCERTLPRGGVRFMFVEPTAADDADGVNVPQAPSASAAVIVGPEGGWSPQEVAMTAPFVSRVTLRGPTLRADAMPIVALTALFTRWNDL
jgi:16S rRNA (uracil1498-N3)-methyltransferase